MYATDKQGLHNAKLGWFFFPRVQVGKDKAKDIFSKVYGCLVSKDAPKETLNFMKALLGKDIQSKLAAEGFTIPMVKGTAEAIHGGRLTNTVVRTVTYFTLTLSTFSPVFLEGMQGNALRI